MCFLSISSKHLSPYSYLASIISKHAASSSLACANSNAGTCQASKTSYRDTCQSPSSPHTFDSSTNSAHQYHQRILQVCLNTYRNHTLISSMLPHILQLQTKFCTSTRAPICPIGCGVGARARQSFCMWMMTIQSALELHGTRLCTSAYLADLLSSTSV